VLLSELKQHLTTVKEASLQALVKHFNVDSDNLRFMLQHWLRKGKVRRVLATPACGSLCQRCQVEAVEIYEWLDVVSVSN
jgi:hypothetical protein